MTFFAKEQLSIAHTRVDEIEDQVTCIPEYQNPGFVWPSSLQEGFFTTTAIDNIDKIFSSVASSNSFHGTTISVFQHSGRDTPFQSYLFQLDLNEKPDSAYGLPESYPKIKLAAE